MRSHSLLSFVVPCRNEEGNIQPLANKISEMLPIEEFEIIFVDDGSTDNTLNKIKELDNGKIRYISFTRNFGHQNALKSGINNAKGDAIICMDADMQHPPEILPDMIQKWKEGFDVVYTIRSNENVGFFKGVTSGFFYRVLNFLSDIRLEPGSADFRLIDRRVGEVLKKDINEYYLFYRGLVSWVGFKAFAISYVPQKRYSGYSKYSLSKMISFAINGITAFSVKPLRLAMILGALTSLIAFCYGLYVLILYLTTNLPVEGWTSLILLTIFLGGVNMLLLGIIGEYLGKLYFESKKRPHYVVQETNLDFCE